MPESSDKSLSDVIEKLNTKIDTLGKEVKDSSGKKGLIGDLNTGLESLSENIVNSVKAPFEGISKGIDSLKDSFTSPFKNVKKFISAPFKGLEIGKKLFGKDKGGPTGDLLKPLEAIKNGIDRLVRSGLDAIPFIAATNLEIVKNTNDISDSSDKNTQILDSTGKEIEVESEKSNRIISTLSLTERTTADLVGAVKNSSVVFVDLVSDKSSSLINAVSDKSSSLINAVSDENSTLLSSISDKIITAVARGSSKGKPLSETSKAGIVNNSISTIERKEVERFSVAELVKGFAETVGSIVSLNTDKSSSLINAVSDKSSSLINAVSDKISSNSVSTISSASDTSSTLAAKSSSILQAIADKSASIFNTVSDENSTLLSSISDKIITAVARGSSKGKPLSETSKAGIVTSPVSTIDSKETKRFSISELIKSFATTVGSIVSLNTDKSVDKTLVTSREIASNSSATLDKATENNSNIDSSNTFLSTIAEKSASLLSLVTNSASALISSSNISDKSSLLSTASDKSSSLLSAVSDKSSSLLSAVSDKSSSLLSTASDKSSSLLSAVSDKSSSLLSTASDKSSSLLSSITDKSLSLLSTAPDKSSSLLSAVSDKSSSLLSSITDKSLSLLSTASDKSSSLLSSITDKSLSLLSTASDKSSSLLSAVSDKSSSSLLSAVSDKSSTLLSAVSDKSSSSLSAVSDKSSTLLSAVSDKSLSLLSTASDKSSTLLSTASDKSSTLLSAVSDKSSSLLSSISDTASSLIDAVSDKSSSLLSAVSDKSSSLLSSISDKVITTVARAPSKKRPLSETSKAGIVNNSISTIDKTESTTNALVSSISDSTSALTDSISKLHEGNSSSLNTIDKTLVESNANATTDRLQEREVQKDRIARNEKLIGAIKDIDVDVSEKIEKKGFLSGLLNDIKFVLSATLIGFGKSIALKVGSAFIKTAGLLKGKLAGTKIGTGLKSMKEKVGSTKIGRSFKERRLARKKGLVPTKNVDRLNLEKVRETPTRRKRGKAGRGAAGKAGNGIAGIGKGAGKGMSGFLSGLGKGLKAISNPKYLIGAGVLISLGGALFVTGKALKQFTGIDWKGVLLGVGVLAALGAGAALLGTMGPQILLGAAAIAALGAALIPAGIAFNNFSGIDWKGVGIGIGVLTALGAAAFGLSLISPAIFVGAAAIAALGAALIPAAAAFNLFSKGLAAFESFIPVLSEFVQGALGGLVELAGVGPGLLVAAAGIAAVSGALIAFGASSALGGLLSFFGGDPIEKFLKLADRAADLSVAGQALKTITDSINQFDSEPIDLMAISIHKLADALGMLQDGLMKKDPLKPLRRLAKIDIEEVANNFKKIGDGASKLIKLAGGDTEAEDIEDNITGIAASSGLMGSSLQNDGVNGRDSSNNFEKHVNESSLVKSGVLEANSADSGAFMQSKFNETTAIKSINEESRASGGEANVVVQGGNTSQVTNTTINSENHIDRTMMNFAYGV